MPHPDSPEQQDRDPHGVHIEQANVVVIGDGARVETSAPAGLSPQEAAAITNRYCQALVNELAWHAFRGIYQVKQTGRVRLADVYLELGLLPMQGEAQRREAHGRLLEMRDEERLAQEERRLEERVTGALARAPRLVILGEPGAGKTISLRFVALALAQGAVGRLGLAAPYLPLMVRLADYARALEQKPALSLAAYLVDYAVQAYPVHSRLADVLRRALDRGECMVLLDGLDEVGDDPLQGRPLRARVAQQAQKLADAWCAEQPCNRVVLTSRIEGYWDEPLHGFAHAELSPLRPPDEIEAFLRQWYTAQELAHETPPALAAQRAQERVGELLPRILEVAGVRRLATNPLLLTILALIHENVGRLPHRRIDLYQTCALTLVESWRQAQTGSPGWLADFGGQTVIGVLAPLAYWLHEQNPGGTASFAAWRERLRHILEHEGFAAEAEEITDRFLHHARQEAGLLAERSLGQYGFFHLTLEEYLAAREMARQPAEERWKLLQAHWTDPRWREVILLAAGQLGIAEARRKEVSDFLEDLLKMEPAELADAARPAVLAGRALVDIGPRSVFDPTRRSVLRALREAMQDCDPETERPRDPPRLPPRARYEAGAVLDELGWLPDDLHAWVRCPGCAGGGGDLFVMKYPVTNAHYERFLLAGGYERPEWWGEEGWAWRNKPWNRQGPAREPGYWRDARFGRERRGYPVVGVSWYEAAACCRWLSELLRRARAGDDSLAAEDRLLVAELAAAGSAEVRLPTDEEWTALAGGEESDRYPWDPPGRPATRSEADVVARANVWEAQLEGTSPVGMYPLGLSRLFGLADLAGNVWEWTGTATSGGAIRVLRGGSWRDDRDRARCAARLRCGPGHWDDHWGIRCVAPVGSF